MNLYHRLLESYLVKYHAQLNKTFEEAHQIINSDQVVGKLQQSKAD